MLSLQNIKSFYPESLHGFERFMLREYLQYKILEIIYDGPYARRLIFMGGTALRIVYDNNRFSEDLDFDNAGISETEFQTITDYIGKKLEQQGFIIEMRNVSKAAYHCYIKFPGLLRDYKLSGYAEERILIRLDTEDQLFEFTPDLKIISKFDVFTEIYVTPENIILAQKFYALLNRSRSKGRDFYDIVFLLSKNICPDFNYLKQKTGISSPEQLVKEVNNKIDELDMNEMADDVATFLFLETDLKRVLLFQKFFNSFKW